MGKNSSNMEIAGVNFFTSCHNSLILQEPGLSYEQFLGNVNKKPNAIDININLLLEKMPDISKLPKIFNCDLAWSMYKDNTDYIITLDTLEVDQPIWLARLDNDFTHATVYCSHNLFKEHEGNPTVLSSPVGYPLDQLMLMYILSKRNGGIIHSAGMNVNGRCYMFPGKSGAGKSTISRLFAVKKEMELLSDDRIVVRKIDGMFQAFGTPWTGDAKIAVNKNFPLAGLFFIIHSSDNMIKEITPREALERLLPVISIPWYDREIIPEMLIFCDELISNIPAFELHFKPDEKVATLMERFIAT